MKIDELLKAPWRELDTLLVELESGKSEIAVESASAAAFWMTRLACRGWSAIWVSQENPPEDQLVSLEENLKAWAHSLKESQDWSIAELPAPLTKDRFRYLLEALTRERLLWCSSPEALLGQVPPRNLFQKEYVALKVGRAFPHDQLVQKLSLLGYDRRDRVEEMGEFSVRGEVLDFWSACDDAPSRVLYAHDSIESIHRFDPMTQHTQSFCSQAIIVPLDVALKSSEQNTNSIQEYLPAKTVLIFSDPAVLERVRGNPLQDVPRILIVPQGHSLGLVPMPEISIKSEVFHKEVERLRQNKMQPAVFCHNMGEARRLEDLLEEQKWPQEKWPQRIVLHNSETFSSESLGVAFWNFAQLTGQKMRSLRLPKFQLGETVDSLSEIKPGDYIVHAHSGIGRYRGLLPIRTRTQARKRFDDAQATVTECLVLEYRGGDKLYVPISDFHLISRYVAQEGKRPELHSLDGITWERTKLKVKQEIADLAEELITTAAGRQRMHRGIAAGDTPSHALAQNLYSEFEEAFPYEETPDQVAAIQSVLQDLDRQEWMDRLICGDVGYGKTEVAMRAAFRVAVEGRQVALLVPTTILAEQHYKNFSERMAAFPVTLGMISRFQTEAEQKSILAEAKEGKIDILIGTHRLLQKDVVFKNLGLIIVDEEHRFGVKQKESLKKLKVGLDFLSMSATPIPRTLSQALGGIRHISVIESPPRGRLPIETYVGVTDDELLEKAFQRELARGGQIFYVHNRIATIHKRKKQLQELFPDIRIGVAHGQMNAEQLEEAMWNFDNRQWDVLLSTTIIESGIDLPNVNTLIVEDSEDFGLAQLYQLRGRVGRQSTKAYCYLFFSGWEKLSDDARKRLEAIKEFSSLGSGLRLALRDMEIRGTGNLLGQQQHGWINAVGLELYSQMLTEEIHRQESDSKKGTAASKKKAKAEWPLAEISLDLPAYIPETYVDASSERILLYKKLADIRQLEEWNKLKEDTVDRFGAMPEEIQTLFEIAKFRIAAQSVPLERLTGSSDGLIFCWRAQDGKLPLDLLGLAREYPAAIEIFPPKTGESSLEILVRTAIQDHPFKVAFDWLRRFGHFVILK